MTNYVRVKIDKTQLNCKCRLWGDRNETINHIISECSKLAQKEYKTRPDWVGKVIHWEMCKKFKFDHTNKWYMYNPESALKNEMHKVHSDFEIQTYYLIPTRWPDLVTVKKKEEKKKENLPNSGLCCPDRPRSKIKRKRKVINTLTLFEN